MHTMTEPSIFSWNRPGSLLLAMEANGHRLLAFGAVFMAAFVVGGWMAMLVPLFLLKAGHEVLTRAGLLGGRRRGAQPRRHQAG